MLFLGSAIDLVFVWGVFVCSFEGVCETHVILTPGACGSGAPNSTSCHHFCWIRWTAGTAGIPGQIPGGSILLLFTMNLAHFLGK